MVPVKLKTAMKDLRSTRQLQDQQLVSILPIGDDNYDFHKKFIRKIAGPSYIFTPELKEIWNLLFLYFIGSTEFEEYGNNELTCTINRDATDKFSLNKSIALIGSYGVGKSTIFRIIHRWLEAMQLKNPNSFRISSTEEVINLFQSKDWLHDVLVLNVNENISGVSVPGPIHILINEFAYHYDVKHFGTDVREFIEMFMMKRYDIFQEHGKLTHVTMNFGINELKKNFSARLSDRFREMFNMIELKGSSFRK